MNLKFDSNLDYQLDAIRSITGLFEGQPLASDCSQIDFRKTTGDLLNEPGISNNSALCWQQILRNLQAIQYCNQILKSSTLVEADHPYSFPNFSVEMETGTGKTYVYLRTIFELNRLYGFKKFIIVVPSIAIREGVIASIKVMKDHFKVLYDNLAFDHFVYQSRDLSRVRQFAVNNEVQIMVINIQAFQKDAGENVDYASLGEEQKRKLNIIHQEQDKLSGRRPIAYVQATNPILIIDEPQSVDTTEKSQKAICNLNPLFCLRYSATHINPYNLVYRLDPIRAYDLRLVKQIEVIDVSSEQENDNAFMRLSSIFYPKNSKSPQAKVSILENTRNGTREKLIKIKCGTALSKQTNSENYEGYVVTNISSESGNEYVEFQNGVTLEISRESDEMRDERMKSQIEQTVEAHFSKEKKLKPHGIKVLSLFFIDHVKSYRFYDCTGSPQKGKIARWFEEAYTAISNKPAYKGLIPYNPEEIHDGYFSADRKKGKIVDLLDTSGVSVKDEETYELIMKDKERLLSFDVPLRFIFSHSALKEGWDNPNVFQICTLREMGSDRERRQTIGRGLRLPVNQNGDRIYDDQINRLTVIANETFENFANGLQSEIENVIDPNGGFKFGRLPQIAFTTILESDGNNYLTQEESTEIWSCLKNQGLIDQYGDFTTFAQRLCSIIMKDYGASSRGSMSFAHDLIGITPEFQLNQPDFKLELPEKYVGLEKAILDRVKNYLPRDFAKNARNHQKVSGKKQTKVKEDFNIVWEKKDQIQSSVKFNTQKLIEQASEKINKMAEIKAVYIEITKRNLEIKESGLESGKINDRQTHVVSNERPLPDILTFLQGKTELTRRTLMEILKKSGRIKEFSTNPEVFMTECAKLINRTLNELLN
ncbi:MAG: DEAD/DEAH box helicase family protein [Candidatus Riflebacteria bacterium]|nr:DEAD/DEAH box helicase family protein [Candidatus Riflebacteria bacterium]